MIYDVYIKYMLLWSAEGHSLISQIIIWRSREEQIQTQDLTRDEVLSDLSWFLYHLLLDVMEFPSALDLGINE